MGAAEVKPEVLMPIEGECHRLGLHRVFQNVQQGLLCRAY